MGLAHRCLVGICLLTAAPGCGPLEPVTAAGEVDEAAAPDVEAQEISASVNFDDGATLVVAAHNDDELLWFQPFLAGARKVVQAVGGAAPAHYNVAQKPATYASKLYHSYPDPNWYGTDEVYVRDFLLRAPCGAISEQPLPGTIYLTQGRDLKVSYDKILSGLRFAISDPAIKRIVTHNHWGEYGHHHHRMVAAAVRQLASEYRKDVWMLSMTRLRVGTQDNATTPGTQTYYRNEGDLYGLSHVTKAFNHSAFDQQRTRYINATVPWSGAPNGRYSTWTWTLGKYDYPSGTRTYVKIVDKGVDRTGPTSSTDAAGTQRLARIQYIRTYDAPIFGNCR
jgi:LmbE family N-acetylglucosaminyl deacetylase